MPRTDVTVLTEDGACSATLHTPSSHGSWPVSVQIRSHPATATHRTGVIFWERVDTRAYP
jgi:hypothetical protein